MSHPSRDNTVESVKWRTALLSYSLSGRRHSSKEPKTKNEKLSSVFGFRLLRFLSWRNLLRYGAGLFRGREIVGQWDRDFTGGGPLGAALQGRDEADAAHRLHGMAHRRVEDAAFAVAHPPNHPLLLNPAAPFLFGGGGGKQVHVL